MVCKIGVLKILGNSQENTCDGVFFDKVAGLNNLQNSQENTSARVSLLIKLEAAGTTSISNH